MITHALWLGATRAFDKWAHESDKIINMTSDELDRKFRKTFDMGRVSTPPPLKMRDIHGRWYRPAFVDSKEVPPPPPAPKPRDVFRVDVSKMTLSEAENLIGTKSFVNVDGYGNWIMDNAPENWEFVSSSGMLGVKRYVNIHGVTMDVKRVEDLPKVPLWYDDECVPPISANPGYYMNTHIAWWKRLMLWLNYRIDDLSGDGRHGGAK